MTGKKFNCGLYDATEIERLRCAVAGGSTGCIHPAGSRLHRVLSYLSGSRHHILRHSTYPLSVMKTNSIEDATWLAYTLHPQLALIHLL